MKPIKILAVDDESNVRVFYQRWGKSKGFDVVAVEKGTDAVERIKEIEFDLVFLDVRMPDIDGLETMRRIKKVAPSLPVFITTGSERDAIVEQAIREGAVGYIYKPFEMEELMQAVDKIRKNSPDR